MIASGAANFRSTLRPQATGSRRALHGLALGLLLIGGCGERGQGTPDGQANARDGSSGEAAPPSERIAGERPRHLADCRFVSLSPALTQVLVDLGLGGQVVGRTPFCDSVPAEVPVVGSLLDVDYERLLALQPTHLVVQPSAAGTDPELERLAGAQGWTMIEQAIDRLEDVEAFLRGFSTNVGVSVGEDPRLAEVAERCTSLASQIASIRTAPPLREPLATLVLVGSDPLTAAGSETFLNELLVAAGGRNVITDAGYPELGMEDLVRLNPKAILLLRESEPEPSEADLALRSLRAAATEASRDGRVVIHVDPMVMLPSTQAPAVVERLRQRLSGLSAGHDANEAPRESKR